MLKRVKVVGVLDVQLMTCLAWKKGLQENICNILK